LVTVGSLESKRLCLEAAAALQWLESSGERIEVQHWHIDRSVPEIAPETSEEESMQCTRIVASARHDTHHAASCGLELRAELDRCVYNLRVCEGREYEEGEESHAEYT